MPFIGCWEGWWTFDRSCSLMVQFGCVKVPLDRQPFSLVFCAVCIYLRDSLLGDNRRYFCVGCWRQTGTVPPCFLALIGVGWGCCRDWWAVHSFTFRPLLSWAVSRKNACASDRCVYTSGRFERKTMWSKEEEEENVHWWVKEFLVSQCQGCPPPYLETAVNIALTHSRIQERSLNMGPAVDVTFRSLWGKNVKIPFLLKIFEHIARLLYIIMQ